MCHCESRDNKSRDSSDAKVPTQDIDPGSAQLFHIKRQERNDHQQTDHVDERRDHQREKPGGDLPHFLVKDVEQCDRDRGEQYAHDWRLERLGDVRLDQKHFNWNLPNIIHQPTVGFVTSKVALPVSRAITLPLRVVSRIWSLALSVLTPQ